MLRIMGVLGNTRILPGDYENHQVIEHLLLEFVCKLRAAISTAYYPWCCSWHADGLAMPASVTCIQAFFQMHEPAKIS